MATPTIKGIDISVYPVKDPERALAFYRDVMGMKPTSEYGGRGAEFTLGDGATFGIWRPEDDSGWSKGSGIMFSVDDAKAAADYYRERGAKIESEVFESPMCFMAFGEDTEGNSFILHQHKAT
jgi:predicted enzyme related to lactoylglutathione lyase